MKTYRCKCGKSEIYSSMGVRDCQTCDKCGSTFARHPDYHAEPKDHDWQKVYNRDTGIAYKECARCGKRDEESYERSKG